MPELQVLWQTQILQPHIIPLQAAMAPHGKKLSSLCPHPLCFAVGGWGSWGEDAVTEHFVYLVPIREGCHAAPQATSFSFWWAGLWDLTQLDVHISMRMPCYTTMPATGILLQPANLGVCPNFGLTILSSAAAECLQCLKSLCT